MVELILKETDKSRQSLRGAGTQPKWAVSTAPSPPGLLRFPRAWVLLPRGECGAVLRAGPGAQSGSVCRETGAVAVGQRVQWACVRVRGSGPCVCGSGCGLSRTMGTDGAPLLPGALRVCVRSPRLWGTWRAQSSVSQCHLGNACPLSGCSWAHSPASTAPPSPQNVSLAAVFPVSLPLLSPSCRR